MKKLSSLLLSAAMLVSGCFVSAPPPQNPPPPQPDNGGYYAPTGGNVDYSMPGETGGGDNKPKTITSYPRVMITIPEFHITRVRVPDPAAETEFLKTFKTAGFKLIDKKQAEKVWKDDVIFKLEKEEDIQAAAALAFKIGAEILVIGEAFSEAGQYMPSMGGIQTISARARVEVKALRTDTAEILWADSAYGTGIDATEVVAGKKALQQAGKEVSLRVSDELVRQLSGIGSTTDGSRTALIEIVLSYPAGTLTRAEMKSFKEGALKGLPNLVEIVEREFIEGVANLEFAYKGDAQGLADSLDGNKFGKRTASVTKVTGNKLFVNLK
jgi:hypothetical protein